MKVSVLIKPSNLYSLTASLSETRKTVLIQIMQTNLSQMKLIYLGVMCKNGMKCRCSKLNFIKGRLGGAEIKQCGEEKKKMFGINFTPL